MRYLLISLLFLLAGCASYQQRNNFEKQEVSDKAIINPYFSDVTKDYVYKANIAVYDKSFGGLFIVKKIEENHHRIVFTTEMGAKIFDFSFHKDEFKVNYVLDEMNKKILLNILEKDFRVLVRENEKVISKSIKEKSELFETEIINKRYYYLFNEGVLNRITRANNGKEKVVFLFSKISDATAKNIQILHKNIKLTINLKSIN